MSDTNLNQLALEFKEIPVKEQICTMCHLASMCPRCCVKCEERYRDCQVGEQICGLLQPAEEQVSRMETWRHLVRTNSSLVKLMQKWGLKL